MNWTTYPTAMLPAGAMGTFPTFPGATFPNLANLAAPLLYSSHPGMGGQGGATMAAAAAASAGIPPPASSMAPLQCYYIADDAHTTQNGRRRVCAGSA